MSVDSDEDEKMFSLLQEVEDLAKLPGKAEPNTVEVLECGVVVLRRFLSQASQRAVLRDCLHLVGPGTADLKVDEQGKNTELFYREQRTCTKESSSALSHATSNTTTDNAAANSLFAVATRAARSMRAALRDNDMHKEQHGQLARWDEPDTMRAILYPGNGVLPPHLDKSDMGWVLGLSLGRSCNFTFAKSFTSGVARHVTVLHSGDCVFFNGDTTWHGVTVRSLDSLCSPTQGATAAHDKESWDTWRAVMGSAVDQRFVRMNIQWRAWPVS